MSYLSCEIECYRQYSSSRLLLQGSLGAGRTPCSSPHTDCPLDTGTALHTLKHTQAEETERDSNTSPAFGAANTLLNVNLQWHILRLEWFV